ncbi:hypothetical protein GCM10022399_41240 [Terrabacter ginsenosidimutans]|uniref:Uncharacterized protein n=1 Tax=Terrabacter ginsenosidimutans TaxID=490575 RepID=A0ABP7EKL9_9MICO
MPRMYRWGDPATAVDGEQVTLYEDPDDLVPASHFGLTIINDERRGPLSLVSPVEEIVVPLERIWGYQAQVSRTHVANPASVPSDNFVGEHAPGAIAWPDGTYQVVGHHRASAACARATQR